MHCSLRRNFEKQDAAPIVLYPQCLLSSISRPLFPPSRMVAYPKPCSFAFFNTFISQLPFEPKGMYYLQLPENCCPNKLNRTTLEESSFEVFCDWGKDCNQFVFLQRKSSFPCPHPPPTPRPTGSPFRPPFSNSLASLSFVLLRPQNLSRPPFRTWFN